MPFVVPFNFAEFRSIHCCSSEMVTKSVVEPQCGLLSRSQFRPSEPRQFSPRWDPAAPIDLSTAFASKHDSVSQTGHEGAKLLAQRSQSSLAIADSVLNKPKVLISKTELSVDSLSTRSSIGSHNLQASRWKPSFLHVGPLLGLSVCLFGRYYSRPSLLGLAFTQPCRSCRKL